MTLRERLQTEADKRRKQPMHIARNFRIHARTDGRFSVYYTDGGIAWPVKECDTLDNAKAEVVARCLKHCIFIFDGDFTFYVKEGEK